MAWVEATHLRRFRTVVLLCGLYGLSACDSDDKAVLPKVDYDYFVNEAYPVLMRDCAFGACHGNSERLFQVYGPGRARLPDAEGKYPGLTSPPKATAEELAVSFARSRSMLLHRGDEIEMAPLLRKPVQGGAHFGVDRWGRNVYRNTKNARYRVLKKWAQGAGLASNNDKGGESKSR